MNLVDRGAKRLFIYQLYENPIAFKSLFKSQEDMEFQTKRYAPQLEDLYQRAISRDSKGFWTSFSRVSRPELEILSYLTFWSLKANDAASLEWFVDQVIDRKQTAYLKTL